MRRILGTLIGIGAFLACLGLAAAPVSTNAVAPLLAEAVAMRRPATVLAAVLAGGAVTVLLLRSPRRHSGLRLTIVGALTAVALVASAAGIHASMRDSTLVPATEIASARDDAAESLGVLVWNTNQDAVAVDRIRALIEETSPDIVVLPEYFGRMAESSLGPDAERAGYQSITWEATAVSVLVRTKTLGEYRLETDGVPPWAGLIAVPLREGAPVIVGTHLERRNLLGESLWNDHLAWAARECDRRPNVIVAGDFNATAEHLEHGGLGQCRDAASTVSGTPGTWPSWLPPQLGAQIDRVMSTEQWEPASFQVLSGEDDAGSDHRPIFAELRPST